MIGNAAVEAIVSGIIIKGIKHLSAKYESDKLNTQIRIYFDQEKTVKYDACTHWQPQQTVTFRQIINRKLDIFRQEELCTPSFIKSLELSSEELDSNDISMFLFLTKNNTVGVSFFNGKTPVKTVKLSQQLERLDAI